MPPIASRKATNLIFTAPLIQSLPASKQGTDNSSVDLLQTTQNLLDAQGGVSGY
jgi:hypothetical protein